MAGLPTTSSSWSRLARFRVLTIPSPQSGRSNSVPVSEVPEGISTDLGPEQSAVDGSVAGTMASLLLTLPPSQQEILRLRVAVGLSAEDTASALGMTAGAVRVAQHRALAKLRGILEGDVGLYEQVI